MNRRRCIKGGSPSVVRMCTYKPKSYVGFPGTGGSLDDRSSVPGSGPQFKLSEEHDSL